MFTLKVIDPLSGLPLGELPDAESWTVTPLFSDVGMVALNYPANGINAGLLTPGAEIAFYLDAAEVPDTRFVWGEFSYDEANQAEDGTVITGGGTTVMQWLDDMLVFGSNWPTSAIPPSYSFAGASVGTVMSTLIGKAHGRGARPEFLIGSWTALIDSNGVPWAGWPGGVVPRGGGNPITQIVAGGSGPVTLPVQTGTNGITITYAAGTTVLQVLQSLVLQGAVEARMFGRTLELYMPGTLGKDWTTASPPIVFRRGDNMTDALEKTSIKGLKNSILVAGANGVYVEVDDPTSQATRGRREGYATQSNISDIGTLTAFGEGEIFLQRERVEHATGIQFTDNTKQKIPFRDFNLGDWIYLDVSDGTLSRLRLAQWVVTKDSSGNVSGAVVLGDMLDEWEQRVTQWIAGLTNGTIVGGGSTPPGGDGLAPGAPTSIAVSSFVYADSSGAAFQVSWPAVILEADGTPLLDLAGYEVQLLLPGAAGVWTPLGTTTDTVLYSSPYPPGLAGLQVRVRAFDTIGNRGAWTTSALFTLAIDNVPPAVPSTPVVSARLGVITVGWDGLGSAGEAMAADFAWCEVHGSVNDDGGAGFIPDATTFLGVIRGGRGSFVVAGLPYNTTYYFKLISVDIQGNESLPSAKASTLVTPLVNTDLIGQIIDGANIIDGSLLATDKLVAHSVTAGQIAALTISAGQIAANAITTDKLDVGSVIAQKIALGVLSTNLVSNPGFEDNGVGVGVANSYLQVPNWLLETRVVGDPAPAFVAYASGDGLPRSGVSVLTMPCRGSVGGLGTVATTNAMAVIGGQEYAFMGFAGGQGRADMRLLTGPTGIGPWTEINDGLDGVLINQIDTSYITVKGNKIIPVGHNFACIRVYNDTSGIFFPGVDTELLWDDFSLTLLGYGAMELTSAGLRMFNQFGDETMNLTGAPGAGGNYLSIQNAGIPQITLDSQGDIAASGNIGGNTMSIGGTDFYAWLLTLPQGVVARGNRLNTGVSSSIEAPYHELEVLLDPGRTYKVCTGPMTVRMNNVGGGLVIMRLRHTNSISVGVDAPAIGVTSTQISGYDLQVGIPNVNAVAPGFSTIIDTGSASATYDHRFLVTYMPGGAYSAILDSTSGNNLDLWVEDIGPSVPDTGIDRTVGSPPATKKSHVDTWNAIWSRSYTGTGANEAFYFGDNLTQGYYSSGNGNQKAAIGFPYAAIEASLSGAVVSKIELFLYYWHWYYGAGGTAIIGYHNSTAGSAPATWSGGVPRLSIPWAVNSGRWVDITSIASGASWASGAVRGILLGPGSSNSQSYYGTAYGASSGNRPRLRFSYVR